MPLACARAEEAHREDGAAVRQAVGADVAAVLLDDLVADRQAEPRALPDRLGGEERVEDASDDIARDARAGVADDEEGGVSSRRVSMVMAPWPGMACAALARRLSRT